MNNMTEKEHNDLQNSIKALANVSNQIQNATNDLINSVKPLTNDCTKESENTLTFVKEDLVSISFALNYYMNAMTKNPNNPVPLILNDIVYAQIDSLTKKVNRMIKVNENI